MSRWKPGERVAGRFVIEGWLASGGMAEVYVAKMTLARGVERRVALKRVHSNLAEDPHFISMFLDEARVVSQLVHPGIIPVHDIVEVEGELLLVLDFVPGWDLSTVLKKMREQRSAVSIGAAVFIARAVAETLAYVHDAVDLSGRPLRIVHRDVNPSNILIAEDGSVRLLDFGVAKAAQITQHTATRGIKGKLAYLAPEQANSGVIDARTDLYGLGLSLFEMVTGERALRASGDIALLETARAPAIPAASVLRPELPEAIDRLITALLAVDPEARPANAAAVARALEEARALVTDTNAEQVRGMVTRAMGAPSRAVKTAQRPLDTALAAAAGLDPAQPGTAALPAARPQETSPEVAEAAARSLLRVAQEYHTTPLPVRAEPPAPVRRSRRGIIAAGATAAAAVLAFGILRERSDATVQVDLDSPSKGFLRIISRPAGAAVKIDGVELRERAPLVHESIAGRRHAIEVSFADHVPTATTALVIEGQTTDVELALERRAGELTIRSVPPGAKVTLDGAESGTTPIVLAGLPRARARLRVELAGHAPFEAEVDLEAQAAVAVDAELEREVATGLLDISSTPWARVHVDGRLVAESTPVIGLRLPVGRHTVVLSNPRIDKQVKRIVSIKRGARASLIVKL